MKIGHLFTPRMRPQAIDVQAAVIWGVAAGTTALWLIQHDRLLLAWGRMCNALGQCCGLSAVLGFCLGQCCGLSGLLNHESNPDMLLAVRALTHLCDVLPSSRAAVVHHVAISCFVARLVTIEYMDLAEQSLQALKKIAQEHPTACLRAGALMAVLSYLDFFSTGVQRIALSTATNMCKKLPSDAADFVMEVVPLLTNLLQYHDAKVLEHTSVCLTRIAEAFASTPDKLDELCNHGLVMQTATLRRRSLIRGLFFLEIIKGNFKFCTKILL